MTSAARAGYDSRVLKRLVTLVGVVGMLLGAARAGDAAPRRRAPAKGLAAETVRQLAAELASEKEEVATAAARRLGELGGAEANAPLVEALSVGMSPFVAAEALAALGKLKDPHALPVLALYAGYVDAKVRTAAVKAIGQIPGAGATELLLDRLGDAAPPVRAAAAEALAERKDARAASRLFRLVARNDAGAAGPLGALMPPDEVPRLAELRGRVDDGVLASALGEFVKRGDVPDRLRVDVVRTLGGIPGAAATAALVEYLASIPDTDQRPSKDEAQKLIDKRGAK